MTNTPSGDQEVLDTEWLQRMRKGDTHALELLIRTHSEALRNYIHITVESYDAAEDVVQDLWVWLWQNRTSITVAGSLRVYLFRAAHNRALNAIRAERRKHHWWAEAVREESIQNEVATPNEGDTGDPTRVAIAAVIASLRSPAREICVLRFEQGMSYAEISEILGIPVGTIGVAISRATKRLMAQIAPRGDYPSTEPPNTEL